MENMSLPVLNNTVHSSSYDFSVKAVQIGEGNFIRAFVDWMIHQCNQQNLFKGSVVVTQPRESGAVKLQKLKEQDGLFTLVTRGLENEKSVDDSEIISSIAKAIDPFSEWESFLTLAEDENIEFIFSNTTEAGIVYNPEDADMTRPIHSFPGRLTAFLYRRYKSSAGGKGFIILPCELLENAGDELKAIILKHARNWHLGGDFEQWLKENNLFLNSLVDRIVTGYPEEAQELEKSFGYSDSMLTVAEPYHQWVIEGDHQTAEKLPFQKAGLNVEWVDNLAPYVKRKVRILNGAHTFMVPIAYLKGHDIVRDAVKDPEISEKLTTFLERTVISTLSLDENGLKQYVSQTLERFQNPYIDHRLLDISLNGTSKFCTRVLPTLLEYTQKSGQLPVDILESLAYLTRFYRPEKQSREWQGWRFRNGEKEYYPLRDSDPVLAAFSFHWGNYEQDHDTESLVTAVLSSKEIWPSPLLDEMDELLFKEICKITAEKLELVLQETEEDQ